MAGRASSLGRAFVPFLVRFDTLRLSSRTKNRGGLVLGAILTIVMMVFILQNLDSAKVSFLAWEYEIPTGIAMLLSAVAGALITAAVGGVRILQVKRQARKL